MIKVRATQDGHYGGYYRKGPIETDRGSEPGEVFEVDEVPHEVLDEQGRPIYEKDENGKPVPVLVDGKQKIDPATKKPIFKIKMKSFFSAQWMERVADNTEVTNDYPPIEEARKHGPLSVYLKKKPKNSSPATVVAMPSVPVESPI